MKPTNLPLPLLCFCIATSSVARADEVTDGLKEAHAAYTEKELSTATEKVREVLKLLEAKNAELMKKSVLPDTIDKWTGETLQTDNLDFVGGGVSLKRVYKQEKSAVNVHVVKDSPMVNALVKLLANDELIEISGARTERVGGQTAIVAEKPSLKLSIVLAERVLVELTPANKETDDRDLIALARKLDYKTLEKMSK